MTHPKVIVTTTINRPSVALQAYDKLEDWHLLVVGDQKTPQDFFLERGTFLTPEMQEELFPKLSGLIGWNSIQRRNIGFLWALAAGAETIATVDDDNIPYPGWGEGLLLGKTTPSHHFSGDTVYDPISVTNYPQLWHRGFPIQKLLDRRYNGSLGSVRPDVQAGFWNGNPDVDAICRMEHDPSCVFDPAVFPFHFDGLSPFNSQNTFLTRDALKKYFMIPHVGRMDDIWGGYYLESLGFQVAYTAPSVFQERNPHDLTIDFRNEVDGYLETLSLVSALRQDPEAIFSFIPDISREAFEEYLDLAQRM